MGISKLMKPRDTTVAPRQDSEGPPSLAPEASAVPARRTLESSSDTHLLPATPRHLRKKKRIPKPPKDTRLRKVVGQILALRVLGKSRSEISEELEIPESTIKTYLYRARKKGLINANSFDDPNDVIETVIKPKVVENVEELLNWRNPKTGLPSMDMTIETAKGIGVFQTHQVQKGGPTVNANQFALKVTVQMPDAPAGVPDARVGTMGGKMAVDAEIVEED